MPTSGFDDILNILQALLLIVLEYIEIREHHIDLRVVRKYLVSPFIVRNSLVRQVVFFAQDPGPQIVSHLIRLFLNKFVIFADSRVEIIFLSQRITLLRVNSSLGPNLSSIMSNVSIIFE